MRSIDIGGSARVVKLYDLASLDIEGVDFADFDLASREDIAELFELVNDYVETGEADSLSDPVEIRGVDPDECVIKVEGERLTPDEVSLYNVALEDLLAPIQEAEEGDLYYIRSMEGDGEWIIESDLDELDISKLGIGYTDCSLYFDQYDVLREGYLELICDTILPEKIVYDGESIFELAEFVFDPVQVWGQLYKVVEDPAGIKVLQKIDYGGRMLAGTDFIVDDFDEN
jgi:hypothetical protein